MSKPIVALVGRPNVGKSTLFNRLSGERLAVIDDTPGTTRDRLFANAEWNGVEFTVVDTGGIDPTEIKVGSGKKPLSIGSAEFIKEIRQQANIAINEADAVVFVVDFESGVTPADLEVAEILRRYQKEINGHWFPPVLIAVNKCDNKSRIDEAGEFYEIAMGAVYPISALHGLGTGDLLDDLIKEIEHHPYDNNSDDDVDLKIAIVGKPNAGKSSILNKLFGQERVIVSPIAGTTRDSIDQTLEFEGKKITLIDTAGIRRRGKVEPGVEKYSVMRTMKAIERSDVALLIIDATTGITNQDAHIAGFIQEAWKSVIIIVNKWDAIEKDTYTINEYTEKIRSDLKFIDYAPMLFVSALTGQRVKDILPRALAVQEARTTHVSTSAINKVIRHAIDMHPTPSHNGRHLKFYYGTQVKSEPPTFLIFVNEPQLMHFTYKRYLENKFREAFPFEGTPIRIVLKKRESN